MTDKFQKSIVPVPTDLDSQIWDKLNHKTKPPGSLGKLERLAFQIARLQGTLTPSLKEPIVMVFAGDHGIAKSGLVNPYPQEVTYQMVMNFLGKGAAINTMSGVAGMQVVVVDAGVNHNFEPDLPMVHAKMGLGTADYRLGPAMSLVACHTAMQKGADIVADTLSKGTNVIGFGEMGIGNTSSASLIMSTLCNIPLSDCVGKGTGATGDFLAQKLKTLQNAQKFHGLTAGEDADQVLATFGGFEIAQMVGGMLEAASKRCLVLVDGFISTAAFLVAHSMAPEIGDFAVFTHHSEELGHTKALAFLKANPLLELQMRLGEGTGCAAAYPLVRMSVSVLNEMASFDSAGVTGKSDE
ncbi:nicotinate-nucleotide--dimethylbenzimidazole phosphoribosyltransferase [Ulvibacterium sp.]|uniref:nicotinate-nucleotide--dimethylbenzimidazole phosphoribosyltransferase n=1 Tax=Ulvibacterium sp. TaxID=2665914 RepID=UPI0026188B65|nr:nicotinate-nucleotide--dimethylbenzimidazole phosphoribosyltransferase [Ulvibacterium sp.]